MDWSNWPAWISLVVAIITPAVTAYLNNRHQLKLKRMELIDSRRLDTIEIYLKSASEAVYAVDTPNNILGNSVAVLLYASESTAVKIQKLNASLEGGAFSAESTSLLYEVAMELKHENKIS